MPFKIKTSKHCRASELQELQSATVIVFGIFLQFANSRALPVVVTNINDKFTQSISNTHIEGRALDISSKNWSAKDVKDCLLYMRTKVNYLGAISFSDNKQRVIIHHKVKGGAEHFHLQVAREVYHDGRNI